MFYLWLRRQVRRVMEPIPIKVAEKYNNKLTFIYVLCAWSMLGLVMYDVFVKKVERKIGPSDTKSTAHWYGRAFRSENMKIFSIQNGRVVEVGAYKYGEDILPEIEDKEFFGTDKQEQSS